MCVCCGLFCGVYGLMCSCVLVNVFECLPGALCVRCVVCVIACAIDLFVCYRLCVCLFVCVCLLVCFFIRLFS